MPKTDVIPDENKPVAARIRAGMTHFGYDERGGKKAFAKRYIGDVDKAPMVTDWRKGRYLPGPDIMRAIAKDWSCTTDWLRFGDGSPPAWFNSETKAAIPIFTAERRADDDVTAIQIAVESLAVALLGKARGAAAEFLADLEAVTHRKRFSMNHALLGRLAGIAEQVRDDEVKQDRAARRVASARRTKPGSRDRDN